MNYQHSYHAGNFADVVKHVLLLQLLEMMSAKPKPYYILDAYGAVSYTHLTLPTICSV